MAAISTFVAIAGLALAAYGASEGEDAEDAAHAARQRQAQELEAQGAERRTQFAAQQRIADIKNQRERAMLARQARVARGQVVNTGANTNTSGASGVAGGAGSILTQAASAGGVFNAIGANQADIITSQTVESNSAVRAGIAGGDAAQATGEIAASQNITNLGMTIFSMGGGYKSIFDFGKTTTAK